LFNALDQWIDLDGIRVVDLYAGSGALGMEALSRGAAHVTFVESDGRTAAIVRANLQTLKIPSHQAEVIPQKALAWLRRPAPAEPVHLVLLDPPYAAGEYEAVLGVLGEWPGLVAGAVVAVEAPATEDVMAPSGLEVLRAKRYGDTQMVFLRKSGSGQAQEPAVLPPAEDLP
jgi:16S rRNA (guanine966-N2)-methyltransferase